MLNDEDKMVFPVDNRYSAQIKGTMIVGLIKSFRETKIVMQEMADNGWIVLTIEKRSILINIKCQTAE